jgi:hypothetical protein
LYRTTHHDIVGGAFLSDSPIGAVRWPELGTRFRRCPATAHCNLALLPRAANAMHVEGVTLPFTQFAHTVSRHRGPTESSGFLFQFIFVRTVQYLCIYRGLELLLLFISRKQSGNKIRIGGILSKKMRRLHGDRGVAANKRYSVEIVHPHHIASCDAGAGGGAVVHALTLAPLRRL